MNMNKSKFFSVGIVIGLVVSAGMPMFAADSALATPPIDKAQPTPPTRTTEQDHQEMMDLLHITSIRRGRDGNNRQSTNYANYDEAKANPFPELPDPLILKNGNQVATAKMWWQQRRPEIVEDFDREIYGRVPAITPKVTWEVTNVIETTNGTVPVITKQLVGHVDNSSYPEIAVNI